MNPALSLLIPTHNRAASLRRLLASIESQLRPEVEVIISDNGSADDTPAMVKDFISRTRQPAQWRYLRNELDVGFDRNLQKLVERAHGTMGWFIGDDDWLLPGALARVLDASQKAPGAIIVGSTRDHDVAGQLTSANRTTEHADYAAFVFDTGADVCAYLAGAKHVHASLAFISCYAFPIKAWPADASRWFGTGYVHLHALWEALLSGTPIVVRDRFLVGTTIGHPARRDAETVGAVRADADAIRQISSALKTWRLEVGVMRWDPVAAWQRVWQLEYPEWRVQSLDQRCYREPAWLFTRQLLLQSLGVSYSFTPFEALSPGPR